MAETSITIRLNDAEKREIAKVCKKLGVRPGNFVKNATMDRLRAEGFVESKNGLMTIGTAISMALNGRITSEMLGGADGQAKIIQGQESEEDFKDEAEGSE